MESSATDRAICGELRPKLPSWSVKDTGQSKQEGADFIDRFDAVCPKPATLKE